MGTWCKLGSKCPTVYVLRSRWGSRWDFGAHSSPMGHVTASCALLVLPLEDLPALTHSTWVAHRYPSASCWLGMTAHRQPKGLAKAFAMCVCVCVWVHAYEKIWRHQEAIYGKLLVTFYIKLFTEYDLYIHWQVSSHHNKLQDSQMQILTCKRTRGVQSYNFNHVVVAQIINTISIRYYNLAIHTSSQMELTHKIYLL